MGNNIKSTEKFADMKNISTFAVHNILEGGEVRKLLWAVFMSARKHIRFHIPVPNYNGTAAFEVLCNGLVWNRFFLFPHNNLINKLFNRNA